MKRNNSIQKKMLFISLLPILILSILIVAFGIILMYRSYTQSIQEELESTTNVLLDCLDLTVPGDYHYEENVLYKGDLNFTTSSMMNRVRERSGIDTTIFWNDTRVLTTVVNESGELATGTKASAEVVDAVLLGGENYYSSNVDVNGMKYIGYYMPLVNSDQMVIGMVFAGKNRQQVYDKVFGVMAWFVVFSVLAVFFAALLIRVFSKQMTVDINGINEFLATIAKGDLTASLNEEIVQRGDELGTIGQYASKMRADLKNLIENDPLTTLFNRRSCNNKLKAMGNEKADYSVVMCDIDWFKKINDNYGHDAGDYVLVKISQMIRDNIKDCGFASRWGGEEFLLIYQLDRDGTKVRVEQLQKAVRDYDFTYGDAEIKITMTFGVEADHKDEQYEERIKRADNKLYIGKNNGRDQIVY